MNAEPTTAEKLRGLPWDITFSAANSIFVQLTFFGSAFVLFLNQLGLSKTQIGSVLSLLPFSGLIAIFIAPTVARFGYKRTFLTFWGARNVAAALLLFTPWVASHLGTRATLLYVIGVVTLFAVCRAVGMTARLPWVQEFVPDAVRGKYSASSNIAAQLTGFASVMVAGYVVERSTGLGGFMALFAAGGLAGVLAVWAVSRVPGGAPIKETQTANAPQRDLAAAARDRNFLFFLAGVGLVILATGPLASFLPLFMQEKVGLSSGSVVLLQTGSLLGGLFSSYLWGWAADRYGSKPVMLSGVFLQALLPLCWMLTPQRSTWSLYAALAVALLQGLADIGWIIGSTRLRFVSVVPAEKKRDYMALYYAWIGIVGGLGQLLGGQLLDLTAGVKGRFLIFSLDSYTILFVAGMTLPALSALALRGVRADSAVGVGEFVALFFRGNPFMALESLIRYHRARDERATVTMTERLGQSHSPLTVDELLKALNDPRFYVRFEAVISIARHGPDERLIQALIEVLEGNEPALSTIAAWALGRNGDEQALGPLRAGLGARYRSVQAHCARSLGTLGDAETIPLLLERLASETDHGLQMAFASALGKLQAEEATTRLLDILLASQEEGSRKELALALARIVGNEHYFIQLLRHAQAETGTITSQAVTALSKRICEFGVACDELVGAMDDCARALAREDLEHGAALMRRVIHLLPLEEFDATCKAILCDCAARLECFGASRLEYVFLALHTMHRSIIEEQHNLFARVFG